MFKKIFSFLFSTRLTAVLFIVFAVAMATGTFLDMQQTTSPTPYSRRMVYNTWWFELIMVVFVINFIGNIFRYRLFRKEKWGTLVLHLSFILILLGAFITRYIGYEGVLRVREGATENKMFSEKTYFTALIDGDLVVDGVQMRRPVEKKVLLSERLSHRKNYFKIKTNYDSQPVTIEYLDYLENAMESLIPGDEGDFYLKMVESTGGMRNNIWLKEGQVQSVYGVLFAVNQYTPGAINILIDSTGYKLQAPFEGEYMRMADQSEGRVYADSIQPLQLRSLYQIAGLSFVLPDPLTQGTFDLVKAPEEEPSFVDALTVKITTGGEEKIVKMLGGQGSALKPVTVEVGGLEFHLNYGSKEIELPFSITLIDFIAERYPGTEKVYSSYKSQVVVTNPDGTSFDYEIYMNHILNHKGYRLFQASFDNDELGTVLSVNHDFWGTWVTYVGYVLLFLSMIVVLFERKSRFGNLRKQLHKITSKRDRLAIGLLLLFSTWGYAQQSNSHSIPNQATLDLLDSLIINNAVDKEHAAKFGSLVIQDDAGRMKPLNTFASELLRKISRSNSYQGLDPNQVFLSMSEFPRAWVELPIIHLKRGNDSLRKILGVPVDTKAVSLLDFFDEEGNNKIGPYLEEASKKSNPNQYEKDLIKTYESIYLLNKGLAGTILRIFPIPGDANNTWVSFPELEFAEISGTDSVLVQTVLPRYFQEIKLARSTGDYTRADELIESINRYQHLHGSRVLPSDNLVKAEIFYNKVDVFNALYKYFLLVGVVMFFSFIYQLFNQRNHFCNMLIYVGRWLSWSFFIAMTLGLILRWYISGHAPWSDAYESVIFVAWATVLFGLILGRKSTLTIASTAFMAAVVMWVAHQNWMDPAISNLQPVLDSYWLMIHVSVIVASYGPFTLGMILGTVALFLMVFTTPKNKNKITVHIKELTIINEMALTIGLVLLTIGNFLGGMWANESWGRYWGWDPKETWALISIMIYAFVIHMRLVPGLRGDFKYNVASIFAYASIMMTYFGVNFYLVGLHSYASGDKPITPTFVFVTIGFYIALSVLAYYRYKRSGKSLA